MNRTNLAVSSLLVEDLINIDHVEFIEGNYSSALENELAVAIETNEGWDTKSLVPILVLERQKHANSIKLVQHPTIIPTPN